MNIKSASALLILSAALHAPAFAQSTTVTFKGQIVEPICNGAPMDGQSHAHITNMLPEMFGTDTTGCEHSTKSLVASARLAHNDAPALPAAFTPIEQDDAEPVWIITYH